MALALFGITNDALNLVVNLLILFLVVIWLALVAWTFFDARRRLDPSKDASLIATATATSFLFPLIGPIIYSILRPPEFIEDKRERGLEIRAAELRLRQLEEQSCPNCEHPVERTYLRCPNCRARIKDPCESCGKPIDPRWSVCPYCETPVPRAAPQPRRATSKGRGRAPTRSQPPPARSTRAKGGATRSERSTTSDGADRSAPRTERPERAPAPRSSGGKKGGGQRRQGARGRPSS